jgi:hypothetical protein
MSHVLLDGTLVHMHTPFQEFPANALLLQKDTLIFGLSCEHKLTCSHVILFAHPSATSEGTLSPT